MKSKTLLLAISGTVGAVAIGYFGSQLLNPPTMILIGIAGVSAGAGMFCIQQLQQRQQVPQTKAQPKPTRNRRRQKNEPRTATRVD